MEVKDRTMEVRGRIMEYRDRIMEANDRIMEAKDRITEAKDRTMEDKERTIVEVVEGGQAMEDKETIMEVEAQKIIEAKAKTTFSLNCLRLLQFRQSSKNQKVFPHQVAKDKTTIIKFNPTITTKARIVATGLRAVVSVLEMSWPRVLTCVRAFQLGSSEPVLPGAPSVVQAENNFNLQNIFLPNKGKKGITLQLLSDILLRSPQLL